MLSYEGMDVAQFYELYVQDVEEYMGMRRTQIPLIAQKYDPVAIREAESLRDYYATRGAEQLARQVVFHASPAMKKQFEVFFNAINKNVAAYGADVGCGSAPIGFCFAMCGHRMDFIDIDGAGAYEFTKWRAKKRGVNAGFSLAGPYDYVLLFDSIEHFDELELMIEDICGRIKDGGVILTNYFGNMDTENPEHINMDKNMVYGLLTNNGMVPLSELFWVKRTPLKEEVLNEY